MTVVAPLLPVLQAGQSAASTFGDGTLAHEPDLLQAAQDSWAAGGWAMSFIATVALLMFGIGIHVWLKLRDKGHRSTPEVVWREWLLRPAERTGPIGRLLQRASGASTVAESAAVFEEIRSIEIGPFRRDLRVMKVCVGAAPLVGLLGTVTGMLTTFDALASGAGGDQTMAAIAAGISEALVTTETGLVIAIPGLFFHYRLRRGLDVYEAFLAHVETVCMQALHGRERELRRLWARRLAKRELAQRLVGRKARSAS